jgi:hypothetical protein
VGVRLVDQGIAVQIETIKENRNDGERCPHSLDIEFAAEPPHRDLKRVRCPVRPQGNRFAIEHKLTRLDCPPRFDHFGNCRGDITQIACVDLDVVAALVHLNSRAIELVLERRFAQIAERLLNVNGRFGQHRLDRLEELEAEPRQVVLCIGEDCARDRSEGPGQHGGAANAIAGNRRGAGDRLDEHTFQCTLPQFAGDEANQKVLFVGRCAAEQIVQQPVLRAGRAAPGRRRDSAEERVDLPQFQDGGRCRFRRSGASKRRPGRTYSALHWRSTEKGDGYFDFVRRQLFEKRRQSSDLLEAAAGAGNRTRGGDHVGQSHRRIVLNTWSHRNGATAWLPLVIPGDILE